MTNSNPTMAPEQRVTTVFQLLQNASKTSYMGEEVTQLEHALQGAQLAKKDGADEATILAILLHDIGHLCPSTETCSNTSGKVWAAFHKTNVTADINEINHARLGAEYLHKLGFPEKTCELIDSHIVAKRYLSAKDPEYLAKLSVGSKQSLKLHGGPFSSAEMREFEKDPLFKVKVQIRKWEEAARVPGAKTPTLDTYREMAVRSLKQVV
ncbi:hypothetical protein IWW37_005238 [Coemansia sp. RSA 2050]|nr:hypothetical protein IWW37_005238 [Coemansia sp. RSA 2050]KAJ2730490.1 hypothetical protein IW152_005214 [Coemansia sp. BCRC 34962]